VGLLDFKSSGGLKRSAVGSIPMHFRVVPGCIESLKRRTRMFGIGMPELVVILVIVLIIFGAGKLPQIGEGIGKGIRNFRKATTKDQEEIDVTPKKTEEISEKK
jgi:sec-independent protein translocase protein TatA